MYMYSNTLETSNLLKIILSATITANIEFYCLHFDSQK